MEQNCSELGSRNAAFKTQDPTHDQSLGTSGNELLSLNYRVIISITRGAVPNSDSARQLFAIPIVFDINQDKPVLFYLFNFFSLSTNTFKF